MIRVVAHVTALDGREGALKGVLLELLEPTRCESGCVFYDVHQGDNPLIYTFIEEWTSDAHLQAHLKSAHMSRAMRSLDGLIACPPDIQRYRLVPGTQKT
ncbi:MAG: quinol monooxygenase YgiN [Kiritimatiellia bacterium]|jgi:quinol monooxygenase YgiN